MRTPDMQEIAKSGFLIIERAKKRWLAALPHFLEKDPTRIFALARLSASLAIPVHFTTIEAAAKESQRLGDIRTERLRRHLEEILFCGSAAEAIKVLDELGALSNILPEVSAMKGVPQPEEFHPEGDVFTHALLCLTNLEREKKNDFILMLAALLHDVGKPPTISKSDRIRFNRHESVGAVIALKIAQRLALGKTETDTLCNLIKSHMKFKSVREMRKNRLKNFVLEKEFETLLALVRADCLASHGDLSDVEFAEKARREFLVNAPPPPLLRGQDLIDIGLSPGPVFSTILKDVEEKRKSGKLKTPEDALAFVTKRYGSDEPKAGQ